MAFLSMPCSLLLRSNVLIKCSTTFCRRAIHTSSPPCPFRVSPVYAAEPLKKKKKIDPAVLRLREDRKKRKIEKEIRRLEKVGRKLKPIDELEVPPKLIHEKQLRKRVASKIINEEEVDSRAILFKEWARYKGQQNSRETEVLERILQAQAKALEELKIVSDDLYHEALQPDLFLVNPYHAIGPVYTPPIKNYKGIDGEYNDITRKWDRIN